MTRGKIIKKCVIFILIAALIWIPLQRVIDFKWETTIEHLAARYEAFEAEPDGTIDVFFIGSSPSYEGYVPAEIYHKTGITSINFGTSNNRPITEYYNLMYALKHQTPKVVVLDYMGFFDPLYKSYSVRDFVENVPDKKISWQTVMAVRKAYPDEEGLITYLLPLMHYHSRWDQLEAHDFNPGLIDNEYQTFLKGNIMAVKQNPQPTDQPLITEKDVTVSDLHTEYYGRIVDECESRGIEVVIILPPRYTMSKAEHDSALSFAAERGIKLWDTLDYGLWNEMGLDPATCFNDEDHLNYIGARIYSDYIATRMASELALPDHRGESGYQGWDEAYELYDEAYNNTKIENQ